MNTKRNKYRTTQMNNCKEKRQIKKQYRHGDIKTTYKDITTETIKQTTRIKHTPIIKDINAQTQKETHKTNTYIQYKHKKAELENQTKT